MKTDNTLLLLVGLCCACGNSESAADAALSTTLVEEGRIADKGGGPAYEFTSIGQVLERADSVYVRQPNVPEIRVFSAGGQHLATIGRNGSGPGEFRSLEAMGFLGDTLWTLDGDLRRLSYFTTSGALLTTQTYEPVSPTLGDGTLFFFPYLQTLISDGTVLGFGGWAARDIASGRVTAAPQLRMTRTGRTLDTLGWVPIGNAQLILRSARRMQYRVQRYSDANIRVHSAESNRLFLIDRPAAQSPAGAVVTVTAIDATGDTAWVTKLPYQPARLDPTEVDSVRAALRKAVSGRFTPEEVDRALYIPAFRPPVIDAVAATDGALWIRWDDATRAGGVTVLDTAGQIRQELTVALRGKVVWASADHLWLEIKDENDVPSLVRYRLSANAPR